MGRVYWGLVRTRSGGPGSHVMELRFYPKGSGDLGVGGLGLGRGLWWVNKMGLFVHGKITVASVRTVMRVQGRVRAAVVTQAEGEGSWAKVPAGGLEGAGQI